MLIDSGYNQEIKYCHSDNTFVCNCSEGARCKMLLQYAQVVYCNDNMCLFNKTLDKPHFINRGLNHTPFADDAFNGVCTRQGGVGMSKHQYTHNNRFKKDVVCKVRSDKQFNTLLLYNPKIWSLYLNQTQISGYNYG